MNDFKFILESDAKSILDSLWNRIILQTSSAGKRISPDELLILSDAYLDLGTEEGDKISEGIRWIVSGKHYPTSPFPGTEFCYDDENPRYITFPYLYLAR